MALRTLPARLSCMPNPESSTYRIKAGRNKLRGGGGSLPFLQDGARCCDRSDLRSPLRHRIRHQTSVSLTNPLGDRTASPAGRGRGDEDGIHSYY